MVRLSLEGHNTSSKAQKMHDNRGNSDVILVDATYPKEDQNVGNIRPCSKSIDINKPSKDVGEREKRNVSFDQIYIREYPICLGDNPSCSGGPPLTVGWEFDDVGCIDLEQYEECRPPRRFGRQMLIPVETRLEMIEQSGVSPAEVSKAVKDVDQCREQRIKTANSKADKKNIGNPSSNNISKLKKLLKKSPRKSF